MVEKMKISDRAKQFMPFSPLTGYDEMIYSTQKIDCEKKQLNEEEISKINEKLNLVKKGDMVCIVFFEKEEFLKVSGMVSNIDQALEVIKVVKTEIKFKDILEISIQK